MTGIPGKLLDTNAVIAFQAGDTSLVALVSASDVLIPVTVIAELYFGAYKSARMTENLKTVDEFADSSRILGCDKITAKYYGEIKEQLRRKGRPIPENDIWIAAVARQYGLALVTRDEHFKQVNGLALETW